MRILKYVLFFLYVIMLIKVGLYVYLVLSEVHSPYLAVAGIEMAI